MYTASFLGCIVAMLTYAGFNFERTQRHGPAWVMMFAISLLLPLLAYFAASDTRFTTVIGARMTDLALIYVMMLAIGLFMTSVALAWRWLGRLRAYIEAMDTNDAQEPSRLEILLTGEPSHMTIEPYGTGVSTLADVIEEQYLSDHERWELAHRRQINEVATNEQLKEKLHYPKGTNIREILKVHV
jgi:hypothetical protein